MTSKNTPPNPIWPMTIVASCFFALGFYCSRYQLTKVSQSPLKEGISPRPAEGNESTGLAFHRAALKQAVYSSSAGKSDTNIEAPPAITMSLGLREVIAKFSSEEARTFGDFLRSLGASEEVVQTMMKDREKTHLNTALASSAILELSKSRVEFEKHLQESLGAEAFGRYKEFEQESRFRNESSNITDFLSQRGGGSAIDQKLLTDTLKTANATTSVLTGGPYGDLPNPTVRADEAIVIYSARIQELKEARNRVMPLANDRFPPEISKGIGEFFGTRISAIQNQISIASRTVQESKSELLQKAASIEQNIPTP